MKPQQVFWIASGSVVAIELLVWVLALPDVDIIGQALPAREAKAALDQEYRHLQELDRRGQNKSPIGIFDAERPEDIARLTGEYLITPPWKDALRPHVANYDRQLADIRGFLTKRSQPLHKPVADSADKLGWYTAYQNASEVQLKRLAAAGALVLPAVQAKEGGAAVPPDLAIDKDIRAIAGFYTKGNEFPSAEEHPRLTVQLRIMERLIDAVLEAKAANSVNVVAGGLASSPMVAAFSGVRWGAGEGGEPGKESSVGLDASTNALAQAHRLTIDLSGPVSVLLAAQAALERSADLERPVVIVTGSELSRRESFAAGDRKDVPTELARLRLRLVVLDFTAPSTSASPAPAAAAAETPQAAPAGVPQ